jgi:hypothetical protein
LALRDALRQRGYEVFVDQYVLEPGTRLEPRLRQELAVSASGVLIWSKPAEESDWVRKEFEAMDTLRRDPNRSPPFSLTVAKLDATALPDTVVGEKFVDFSEYPEGPRGKELLSLLFGLRNEPLSEAAVERVQRYDSLVREELLRIRGWAGAGDRERIVQRARDLDETWLSTPQVPCAAGQTLIDIGAPGDAIPLLKDAIEHFPLSIRPRQLLALAYRRMGKAALDAGDVQAARNATNECIEVCARLKGEDQYDPETLGIFAAALTQRWEIDGTRPSLMQAQAFYSLGFERSPGDYYSGINAASKAVLLGDGLQARKLATKVLALVDKAPMTDYWGRSTVAEANLLSGDISSAARLYRETVTFHAEKRGNIKSTLDQVLRLVPALKVPQAEAEPLLRPFSDVLEIPMTTLLQRCFGASA